MGRVIQDDVSEFGYFRVDFVARRIVQVVDVLRLEPQVRQGVQLLLTVSFCFLNVAEAGVALVAEPLIAVRGDDERVLGRVRKLPQIVCHKDLLFLNNLK